LRPPGVTVAGIVVERDNLPGDHKAWSAAPELQAAVRLLRIAGSPIRLAVIAALRTGELSLPTLRERLGSPCGESLRSHVNLLCDCGLLTCRVVSRNRWYALTSVGARLLAACDMLVEETPPPAPAEPRPRSTEPHFPGTRHPRGPRASASRSRPPRD
jgi:hypothetical protein